MSDKHDNSEWEKDLWDFFKEYPSVRSKAFVMHEAVEGEIDMGWKPLGFVTGFQITRNVSADAFDVDSLIDQVMPTTWYMEVEYISPTIYEFLYGPRPYSRRWWRRLWEDMKYEFCAAWRESTERSY